MSLDHSTASEVSTVGTPRTAAIDALGQAGSVWLYDGMCGFCNASVRFFLARERPASDALPPCVFVAIQSATGRRLALAHGVDPDDPSTFLFLENGVAYPRSAGVIAIAKYMRLPWRLIALWRFLPQTLRDRHYDWVARNRYRIAGRKESCEIPSPEVRARFILPD